MTGVLNQLLLQNHLSKIFLSLFSLMGVSYGGELWKTAKRSLENKQSEKYFGKCQVDY